MKKKMNCDNPLISIIVPVYNVEDYLKKCLNSLTHQTYRNLEIIIINDGSTDGSLRISKKFEKLDNRVVLFTQKNQGLSSARNMGIKRAHGAFFTFVDSDDYLEEDYIENLYNAIIKFNCDIAIGGTTYEWPDYKVRKEPAVTSFVSSVEIIKMFILNKNGVVQSAWGKLYNSKIANVMTFPIGKLYEDQFVMYHIVINSNCCIVNGSTYHYRQDRPGSILNTKDNVEKKVTDFWESLISLKDLFEKQPADLKEYFNYKVAVDSLHIIRYCLTGDCNHLIYNYALKEIKNTNLLNIRKLGLDWWTWLQMFLLKYSSSVYRFLFLLKYKD